MDQINHIHNRLAAVPINPYHRMKILRLVEVMAPVNLTSQSSRKNASVSLSLSLSNFKSFFHCFFFHFYRYDNEQPSTSKCSKVLDPEPANLFNTIAYSSFGKASICSSFSAKSGSSTTTEVVDLLKTISKDEDNYKRNNTNAMANLQDTLNDVNSSIR